MGEDDLKNSSSSSSVLSDLQLASRYLDAKCIENVAHEDDIVTIFHATSHPDMSVEKYAERIYRYGKCSGACFVNALVLIERVSHSLPIGFQLSLYCVHRLFVVCVLLSTKTLDDVFYSNRHWARVAGLSLRELNALELDTLDYLGWRAFVSAKEYDTMKASLQLRNMSLLDKKSTTVVINSPTREEGGASSNIISNVSNRNDTEGIDWARPSSSFDNVSEIGLTETIDRTARKRVESIGKYTNTSYHSYDEDGTSQRKHYATSAFVDSPPMKGTTRLRSNAEVSNNNSNSNLNNEETAASSFVVVSPHITYNSSAAQQQQQQASENPLSPSSSASQIVVVPSNLSSSSAPLSAETTPTALSQCIADFFGPEPRAIPPLKPSASSSSLSSVSETDLLAVHPSARGRISDAENNNSKMRQKLNLNQRWSSFNSDMGEEPSMPPGGGGGVAAAATTQALEAALVEDADEENASSRRGSSSSACNRKQQQLQQYDRQRSNSNNENDGSDQEEVAQDRAAADAEEEDDDDNKDNNDGYDEDDDDDDDDDKDKKNGDDSTTTTPLPDDPNSSPSRPTTAQFSSTAIFMGGRVNSSAGSSRKAAAAANNNSNSNVVNNSVASMEVDSTSTRKSQKSTTRTGKRINPVLW